MNKYGIPWVGYTKDDFETKNFLSSEYGLEITPMYSAVEILEAIQTKIFSAVIVNGVLPRGNLEDLTNTYHAKELVKLGKDFPKISQYAIKEIRETELNSETPIIANLIGDPSYESYCRNSDYRFAGANHVVMDACDLEGALARKLFLNLPKNR